MDGILETMGWIGSMMLAFCALPQAVQSWRTKSSGGVTWGLLVMWAIGEVFTFIYVWPKADMPLLVNYSANIAFLSVIMYYKVFSRT
jgi:uncharacterized protein with PQ loop repeat